MKMKVSRDVYEQKRARSLTRPSVCSFVRGNVHVCMYTWYRPSMSYPSTGTYLIAARDVNPPYNLEAGNFTTYTASRRRRLRRFNDLHSATYGTLHAHHQFRVIDYAPVVCQV